MIIGLKSIFVKNTGVVHLWRKSNLWWKPNFGQKKYAQAQAWAYLERKLLKAPICESVSDSSDEKKAQTDCGKGFGV